MPATMKLAFCTLVLWLFWLQDAVSSYRLCKKKSGVAAGGFKGRVWIEALHPYLHKVIFGTLPIKYFSSKICEVWRILVNLRQHFQLLYIVIRTVIVPRDFEALYVESHMASSLLLSLIIIYCHTILYSSCYAMALMIITGMLDTPLVFHNDVL